MKCVICSNEFEPKAWNHLTCSPKCAREFQNLRRRREKESRKIMKTCMVCGTEFPAHKNARALCSRKCKTAYETKQYKERLEQYSEKISPIMILYIIDMNLRAGMSLSAIAKLLNKSQTVIETRLEEARQSGLYERAVTQLKATYKDWPYVYQGKDRRVAKG